MAKTDFLTADMTRRQFMKISGKSLAGLTLSASMLSLFGCSQKQVDAGAVATWALPQGLLVVNADLCTGCQRCEINCTLTNDGVCSSYISRVKIQRRLNLDGDGNGLLSGTDNCFVYFPDPCRQCDAGSDLMRKDQFYIFVINKFHQHTKHQNAENESTEQPGILI